MHSVSCLGQLLLKELSHSLLTAIVFCLKKSSTMFISLIVISLLIAGRGANELGELEGEEEMMFAFVSINFSL